MDVSIIFGVFICAIFCGKTQGFICYKCSYSLETEGSRRDCIENPVGLGFQSHIECNATSFCVLQEQYDLHREMVTSYFRSCSGNTWGNECSKDWSHVSCKSSCRGNFCNEPDVGKRYEQYLKEHEDDGYFNSGRTFFSHHFVNVQLVGVILLYLIIN